MTRNNKGNVLFLILIAVALFAALSYAVTRSGRGAGTIDREALMIALAEAQQQAQQMVRAVDRMVVIDGIPIEQISVVNDVWYSWLNAATHNENPNCTTTDCRLFHPDGGGIVYPIAPAKLTDTCRTSCTVLNSSAHFWHFTGQIFVPGLGDSTRAEFVAGMRVDQQTCIEINKKLGITNPAGAPPVLPGSGGIFPAGYKGTFGAAPLAANTLPAELTGQLTGCYNQNHGFYSNDYAWFYVVLMVR